MLSHIVYQAHGSKDVLHECCLSIASLQLMDCIKDNVRLHVFTDQKGYLQQFLKMPVIYHDIDNQTIASWRGDINFIHRVKIKVLQQLCSEVAEGLILYLDSDVIAINDIKPLWQKIDSGKFVMHVREGNILHSQVRLFKNLIPVIEYGVAEKMMATSDFDMWNAGVIGFRADHCLLLQEVLALTDSLYAIQPKHVIEQLSFSYVFHQNGGPEPAADVIYHYWNLKEFRQILAHVYSLPQETREPIINNILINHTIPNLFAKKTSYYSQPINKFLKLFFRKKWKPPDAELLVNEGFFEK